MDLGQTIRATVVLALTFLLRGDLGLCATTVFVCLATYHTVCGRRPLRESLSENGRVLGLAMIPFALVLLPFFIFTTVQGVVGPFTLAIFGKLADFFSVIQRSSMISLDGTSQAGIPKEAGTLLARLPIEAMWESGPQQVWAILTYLPPLVFAIALFVFLTALILRRLRGSPLWALRAKKGSLP